jgi:hypothetical protein
VQGSFTVKTTGVLEKLNVHIAMHIEMTSVSAVYLILVLIYDVEHVSLKSSVIQYITL